MISMVLWYFCMNEVREYWIYILYVELLGVYYGYG